MIIRCAWCKEYQGEKEPLEDLRITDTICPSCLAEQRRVLDEVQSKEDQWNASMRRQGQGWSL